MATVVATSALDFATRAHASQRRDSDGAPFIEHPIEVGRLLRDAGGSDELVAAGLLHDVVENTTVSVEELATRFGPIVAALVRAVSDNAQIDDYRQRKFALREQVRGAGEDAALLFAADKISKVRELRDRMVRAGTASGRRPGLDAGERLRLEHYRHSLAMLRDILPRHPLVRRLALELSDARLRPDGGAPRRRRLPAPNTV